MKKILIFKKDREENEEFLKEFNKIGNDEVLYTLNTFNNMTIIIEKEITILANNVNILDYDLVFFKNWTISRQLALTIAKYLESKNRAFVEYYLKKEIITHKLYQTALFQLNGLSVPKTLFTNDKALLNYAYISNFLGEKFVMKAGGASEGRSNYLIQSEVDFAEKLSESNINNIIFQEFIENDFDYRIVVLGGKVSYIKKRSRKDKSTHKNNVYLGAEVEYVSLENMAYECQVAEKASALMNVEVAGVDAIVSEGKVYLLEVNRSPALRHDFSVLKHLNEYFISLIKK